MNEFEPQVVTFSEVCHTPLLPGAQYDYTNEVAVTPAAERRNDRQAQDFREMVVSRFGSQPHVTDTDVLLDDGLYEKYATTTLRDHAITTQGYSGTPRTFSESMGIYVKVGVELTDDGIRGEVVETKIPNKDFTDAKLAAFRQLDGFRSDPERMANLVYYLRDIDTVGRAFKDYSPDGGYIQNTDEVCDRVQDALQPSKLSNEALIKWFADYGRRMTVAAADNARLLPDIVSKYMATVAATSANEDGVDHPILLERRLGGFRVETYDELYPEAYQYGVDWNISKVAGFCDADIGFVGINAVLGADDIEPLMFHEIGHAKGATTHLPASDTNGDLYLPIVGHSLKFWDDTEWRGERVIEGLVEAEAAHLYQIANGVAADPTYEDETARIADLENSHTAQLANARSINMLGIKSPEDQQNLYEINRAFEVGLES